MPARLAEGYTNQAIAEQVDLIVKTIESYRARRLRKLGLRSWADILRCVVAIGLLGPCGQSDMPTAGM